jgi:hypothetical protein
MSAASRVLLGALLAAVAGCASPSAGDDAAGIRRSATLITREELLTSPVVNLFDAIQQLRPRFLMQRGESSINFEAGTRTVVYVDGSRAGYAEVLQSIHPGEVFEVRYLDGPQATARFGLNHGGGAILVVRNRGVAQ